MSAVELVADGLVKVEFAHGFLGISRAELYRRMEQGQIPFTQIGRRRLIPKRALVEYAASNTRNVTPTTQVLAAGA